MNKTELVAAAAQKAGVTKKEACQVVNALLSVIAETVHNGEDVRLVGFGSFRVRRRAARTGRNPRTGKAIRIPAKTVPVFKPGKAFA
ncbi:MAG: HU family DNA-binding protein [bacterium]|jgi:DNA-binding protein HU-beta